MEYFVNPATGSDGFDGTEYFPFATIAKANSVAVENDTVFVSGSHSVTGMGTFKAGVVYQGEGSSTVVEVAATSTANLYKTVFRKMVFRPSPSYASTQAWMWMLSSAKVNVDMQFFNCVFEDPYNRLPNKGTNHACFIASTVTVAYFNNIEKLTFENCTVKDNVLVTLFSEPAPITTTSVVGSVTTYGSFDNPTNSASYKSIVKADSFTGVKVDEGYRTYEGASASSGVFGGTYSWGTEDEKDLTVNVEVKATSSYLPSDLQVLNLNGEYVRFEGRLSDLFTGPVSPKGHEVYANAYSGSDMPWKAFDGGAEASRSFWFANGAANSWIDYKYEFPVKLEKLSIVSGVVTSGMYGLSEFTVQGSNDGVSYINIAGPFTHPNSGDKVEYDVDSIDSYLIYRVQTKGGYSGATQTLIVEMEHYGSYALAQSVLKSYLEVVRPKTYFVSETKGSDGFDGSRYFPFQTVDKANEVAEPKDTIFIEMPYSGEIVELEGVTYVKDYASVDPTEFQVMVSDYFTSATSPRGHTVSADSQYSSQHPWYACELAGTRSWQSAATNTTHWLMYDYKTPTRVEVMKLRGGHITAGNYGIKSFTVQGSSDGTSWDNLLVVSNHPNNGNLVQHDLDEVGEYRYYRLYDIKSHHNTGVSVYVQLWEMYVYQAGYYSYRPTTIGVRHDNFLPSSVDVFNLTIGPGPRKKLSDVFNVPYPNQNTSPNGHTLSASSARDARDYAPGKACDGNANGTAFSWMSNNLVRPSGGDWLRYNFPVPVMADTFRIIAWQAWTSTAGPGIKDYEIYGLNLDTNVWERFHKATFPNKAREWVDLPVDTGGKFYKSYRINILNSYETNATYVNYSVITEMEIFGSEMEWNKMFRSKAGVAYTESLATTLNVRSYDGVDPNALEERKSDIFTDYTSPKGHIITADSFTSTNYPWKAFDGSFGSLNFWLTNDNTDPKHWLRYQFPTPTLVDRITVQPRIFSSGIYGLRNFIFEGSNDGRVYNRLYAGAHPNDDVNRSYSFPNKTAYRFYRFIPVDSHHTSYRGRIYINEIAFYGPKEEWYSARPFSFMVPYVSPMPTTIRINPHGFMEAKADVGPVHFDLMPTTISVKNHDNMMAAITVPPWGRMSAVVDVIPPPMIPVHLTDLRDAFVRSDVPRLSYGTEQEMAVGFSESGAEFRSLVYFDDTMIPDDMRIVKANLILYNDQVADYDVTVGIYEILEDWTEYGTTWANQPPAGDFVTSAVIPNERGFVEIDLLGLVREWNAKTKENKGLYIVLEEEAGHRRFSTRERGARFAPYIDVEYYDPDIKSVDYTPLGPTTIRVRQQGKRDLNSRLTVRAWFGDEDINTEMKVKRDDTLESSINASKDFMVGNIRVRRRDTSPLDSTLRVRRTGVDGDFDTKLGVPRKELLTGLRVRRRDTSSIDAAFTVRQRDKRDITGYVGISRDELIAGLTVYKVESIEGGILVRKEDGKNLTGRITVRQTDEKDLPTEVNVRHNDDVTATVGVRSGFLASGIKVPWKAAKTMRGRMTVLVKYASDMPTFIAVQLTSPIETTMRVRQTGWDDLQTKLHVRQFGDSDLPSTISVAAQGSYAQIL